MEARRVVVVDVGLAEAFRCRTIFRFIAAWFKRGDAINRTGLFVGCEPANADSITTSSLSARGCSGRRFSAESECAQRKRARRKRLWRQRGESRYWESCGYS
jgi:hypothetical protein